MKWKDEISHKPGVPYFVSAFAYLCLVFIAWLFNHQIFNAVNGFWSELLRYPMLALTTFGDGVMVLIVGSLLYKYRRGQFWPFLVAFAATGIIIQLMKSGFNAPRPMSVFQGEDVFFMGEKLFQRSFPSGHSASALVLTRFLQVGLPRHWSILIFIAGILTALSRVYIGAHFPLDVLVGGGIGYLTAHHLHIYAAQRALHKDRPEYRRASLGAAVLGAIASLAGLFTIAYRYYPLTIGLQILMGVAFLYFLYVIYDQGIKTARSEF